MFNIFLTTLVKLLLWMILSQYLHNGVDWACFLTKSTVNALGHVDVVACSSSTAIRSLLCLYCNSLTKKPNTAPHY